MSRKNDISVTKLADQLQNLDPYLDEKLYIFYCQEREPTTDLLLYAEASVHEEEGLSLILSKPVADRHGIGYEQLYARIILRVFSSLQSFGLTAAVSNVLAKHKIPCNMVAGYHHDHLFVPKEKSQRALHLLKELSQSFQSD